MKPVTSGERLRRLMRTSQVPGGGGTDSRTGRSAPFADDLAARLGGDPEVGGVPGLQQLVRALADGRDEIPPFLRPALCRALGVPALYFDSQAVADVEDARRLAELLTELGVVGAHLCRCPVVTTTRLHLWAGLVEVAREHTGIDLPVDRHNDY